MSLLRRWRARPPEKPLRDELLSIERLEERAQSARRAAHHRPRLAGRRAERLPALRRERGRPAPGVPDPGRGRAPGRVRHGGRGVAARQLPPGRGRDPRRPAEPAARLLPRAAEARRPRAGGPRARLRDGGRADPAQRRRLDLHQLPLPDHATRPSRRSRSASCWAWPSMLKLGPRREPAAAGRRGDRRPAAARRTRRRVRRPLEAAAQGASRSRLPRRVQPAFVVQLLQRVREYGPRLRPSARRWTTASPRCRRAAKTRSAPSTSGRRRPRSRSRTSITSLRLCATLDWSQFFERVSLVEQSPAARPGGRLRADGLPEPRPLSPGGRGPGRRHRRGAGPGRAARGRERAPGRRGASPGDAARRTSATT